MRHRGPVAPRKTVHPLTGEPIVPVGYVNGRPVWPILGGDASNDDDDDDQDDNSGDSGAGGGNDQGDKTGSDGDDTKVDRTDLEALEKRMKAADRRADEAERKLKQIEDAKKDDLTKAQDELGEVKNALEQAQSLITSLRLQNAFLTANKHSWHDPDTALDLAQSKGYLEGVLTDDGEVDKKALGNALDRLAKEKAFLVKSEDKKEKDDDQPPSGQPAGGRSDNTKDEKARKQRLQRRFPAINR